MAHNHPLQKWIIHGYVFILNNIIFFTLGHNIYQIFDYFIKFLINDFKN